MSCVISVEAQQKLHTGWGGDGYRIHKRAEGRKTKIKLTGAGLASCVGSIHLA